PLSRSRAFAKLSPVDRVRHEEDLAALIDSAFTPHARPPDTDIRSDRSTSKVPPDVGPRGPLARFPTDIQSFRQRDRGAAAPARHRRGPGGTRRRPGCSRRAGTCGERPTSARRRPSRDPIPAVRNVAIASNVIASNKTLAVAQRLALRASPRL